MTAPTMAAVVRDLPKVELHCHLEGAIAPETIADLARANGVALPVVDPRDLYRFADLTEFLDVYSVICASLRTVEDFHRVTYEVLAAAAADRVRYREMFFSPGFFLRHGVGPATIWEGIRAGLADAHTDLDIRARMILDVDKDDPAGAVELVTFAAAQDRDELIGIGGDSTERGVDHRAFAPAFELAARHGLRRTMHAGEDGPVGNIAVCLDDLGCQRIDHGVRLVDDPALLARVAAERIPLTCCPLSNVLLTRLYPDVPAHPFGALRAAGVLVSLNSDDPGMMGTTISDDYEQTAAAFGYDLTTMAGIALDAVDASWAPPDEKRDLRARLTAEIAELLGTSPS